MDYTLWDLICNVLEFDVDDEAAYHLVNAAPWKIITGRAGSELTMADLYECYIR